MPLHRLQKKINFAWKHIKATYSGKGIILMYHSIANVEVDPWNLHVSPVHFSEQLACLKKHFHVLGMPEYFQQLQNKQLESKTAILTFDDGYANNFNQALPLLEKYKIPATFFICTKAIDSQREFWWDELEQVIFNAPEKALAEVISYFQFDAEAESTLTRTQLYYRSWEKLQKLSREEQDLMLADLERISAYRIRMRASHRPLSRQELRQLEASPFATIGAHTLNHPVLESLSSEEQRKEILGSKVALEKYCSKTIKSFSYPFGAYNEASPGIVCQSGFQLACTTKHHLLSLQADPYLLPRIQVNDQNGRKLCRKLIQKLAN